MTRPASVRWAGVALTITAALLGASLWTRASVAPRTRATLAASFESDLRHVVLEWDPNDPRPQAERRRALFEFVYQTYDASAWIPQSLFDSNLVTQAVVGDVGTIVGDKVGLVLWRDNPRVPAFGMAPNAAAEGRQPLEWPVNCLGGHAAGTDGG